LHILFVIFYCDKKLVIISIGVAEFLNEHDKEVFGMMDNLTVTDDEA